VEWNGTAALYAQADESLHGLVWAQAGRTPESVAVVFEGEALTYGELRRRAPRLGERLAGLGVGPEAAVGICAERSVELVVGLLGILEAGGAYVPLDPGYPRERLAGMVADAGLRAVLAPGKLWALLGEIAGGARLVPLDEVGGLAGGSERGAVLGPEQLAYAIFTSGSTGRPKGAMNTHGGIVNRLLWMQERYGLGPDDAGLQKTPFSFDVSVWEFFWPLVVGARLVVAKPGGHQDAAYLVELIAREGVTTAHFVPSMLGVFLEAPGVEGCVSLRRVMASGEALGPEVVERYFGKIVGKIVGKTVGRIAAPLH